jgi:hypothetical protein
VVKDREKLNPKSKRFIFVGCGNHVKSTTYACDPVSLNILREREREALNTNINQAIN